MLSMYPELFTEDFETNKHLLKEKSPVKLSKKERNKVAGYIVRLLKLKRKNKDIVENQKREFLNSDEKSE